MRGVAKRFRRSLATVGTATLFAAVALFVAPSSQVAGAQADAMNLDGGLWYFDDFRIADLHEQGVTGEGVTIAVIDSPINLDVPDLEGADVQPRTAELCPGYTGVDTTPQAQHATAMTSFIVGTGDGLVDEQGADHPGVHGIAPDAKVLHYAVLNVPLDDCNAPLTDFVADAIDQGADIINLSISYGSPGDAIPAVTMALNAGLVVNVAVQNANADHLDLLSGMNGVVSIENVDQFGRPDEFSVRSAGLDFVAPGVGMRMITEDFAGYKLGDGTSPATAWASGAFALGMSAWPDATGNQLLQSAIRHTENREHGWQELERTEAEGFGLLSPRFLIELDPRGYPDENPLLVADGTPSIDEVTDVRVTDPGIRTVDHRPGASVAPDVPAPPLLQRLDPRLWWLLGGFVIATGVRVVMLRRERSRDDSFFR